MRLAQLPSAGVLATALVAAALLAFGVAFGLGRLLSESSGSNTGQALPGQPALLRLADATRVATVRPLSVAPSTVALPRLSKTAPLPVLRPPPARPAAPPVRSEPPAASEPPVTSTIVVEPTFSEPEPPVPVAVTRRPRRPEPPRKPKRVRRKPPVVIVGEG